MQLTGTAGAIVGIAVTITAYAIVIMGLFVAWSWIFDYLLVKVLDALKMYEAFAAWVIQYRKNKKR